MGVKGITLATQVAWMHAEVDEFYTWWHIKHREDPENFPNVMLPGEWDEQFKAWQEMTPEEKR